MRRWILIENEHGEEELLPYDLETEGTTVQVSAVKTLLCFLVGLAVVTLAGVGLGWLVWRVGSFVGMWG